MSSTRTTVARTLVAMLLGLAACLVVWWPQGAVGQVAQAGVDGVVAASQQALKATPTAPTKFPTTRPTSNPTAAPPSATATAPVGPDRPTQAPEPATTAPAPAPVQPSHAEPKPAHGPKEPKGPKGDGGHGNGGKSDGGKTNGGGQQSSGHQSSSGSSTTTAPEPVVTSHAAVVPAAPATPTAKPTAKPSTKPSATPTKPAASASPAASTEGDSTVEADASDTYLTSSEPAETGSAPVWVIPGVLLVITSMLALLGGLLGRHRSAPDAPQE